MTISTSMPLSAHGRAGFSSLIFRQFQDQHYSTVFNQQTGFFARIEEPGYEEPFWSWHGPELLDISITNWCDRECRTCYRRSNQSGKHMSLSDYEGILRQAHRMCVFQIALGGGNPNQHPDFCEILRLTRNEYGIIPSYTTNGRGLTDEILEASSRFCGVVAVSAYSPYEELTYAVKTLLKWGIRTNIHFVLDSASVETATRWLMHPPSFLNEANAIVFLNYKPVGRCTDPRLLLRHSSKASEFFEIATRQKNGFRIGFDSCLVTGLVKSGRIPTVLYDGCDSGRFSMFISEDMRMYPCSFMEADHEGIPIEGDNMVEVWQNGHLFVEMRNKLAGGRSSKCTYAHLCLGGCPIFSEINLCFDQGACWKERTGICR
jgi:radical SAM protein with 4Fe4S-binding SPASM domain